MDAHETSFLMDYIAYLNLFERFSKVSLSYLWQQRNSFLSQLNQLQSHGKCNLFDGLANYVVGFDMLMLLLLMRCLTILLAVLWAFTVCSLATPQVQKKKIWESVQPHLKTTDDCVAVLGIHPMRTSAGMVTCKTLKNGRIS